VRIVLDVGSEREGMREEVADATMEQVGPDLLSATSVANVIGVASATLIAWLDAGDPQGDAPPAIKRGSRYVFRPASLVPWLEGKGYRVPPNLRKRAAKDAA
jgi:hypothetical protein